ncbi:MAG: DUF2884 family protein, partial [Calditrichia bacterium]
IKCNNRLSSSVLKGDLSKTGDTMMKALPFLFLFLFVIFSAGSAADLRDSGCGHHVKWDNVDFDLEDGAIVFTHTPGQRESVKFTEDQELFVNHERVKLNRQQRKLVGEFYEQSRALIGEAKRIGWEGAKLGSEGAKVGLQAVAGILDVIFTEYDSDDLEDEMERKAEVIEKKAEKLEARADKLEEKADNLEELRQELKEEIPELHDLDWF